MSDVQAILFDRAKWDSKSAKSWLKSHGYKPIKRVHITKQYRRYRIQEPIKGSKYSNKDIGGGIHLVLIMPIQRGGNQSKTIDDLAQADDHHRFNSGVWNWARTYDYAPYSTNASLNALESLREASRPPAQTVINIHHEGKSSPESAAIVANAGLDQHPISALEQLNSSDPSPNLAGAGMHGGTGFSVFPSVGSQLLLHGALKLGNAIGKAKKVIFGSGVERKSPGIIRDFPGYNTMPLQPRPALYGNPGHPGNQDALYSSRIQPLPLHLQRGYGHVSIPYSEQYIGQRPYSVFH